MYQRVSLDIRRGLLLAPGSHGDKGRVSNGGGNGEREGESDPASLFEEEEREEEERVTWIYGRGDHAHANNGVRAHN